MSGKGHRWLQKGAGIPKQRHTAEYVIDELQETEVAAGTDRALWIPCLFPGSRYCLGDDQDPNAGRIRIVPRP